MIVVEPLKGKSVVEQEVEIVERKGTGHPDFICDSIMESISVALSGEYTRLFGTVLHHNIDKGLLAAGRAKIIFGGGELIAPMELTIGDRATFAAGGKKILVKEIAVDAARQRIRNNLRLVDPEKHVKYRTVLAPASSELSDIFSRPGEIRGANDTSALIGYYPLSPTEQVVLSLERYLNSPKFKKKYPYTGEDIKVMGLRKRHHLDLTVAMPLIAGSIRSEDEYFERKELVKRRIEEFLGASGLFAGIAVGLNVLDERGRGIGGVYLSLLGTSAENADSGQVGRGNRVNGLISMNRPMGTEAAAGKNPVSHVGKIYNVLSHKTAEKIYKNVEGIREVYVLLLSKIGAPVNRPHMASAKIRLEKGFKIQDVSKRVEMIMERELADIALFCKRLAEGEYPAC
jgi:S-adenosylmethionine synthetase